MYYKLTGLCERSQIHQHTSDSLPACHATVLAVAMNATSPLVPALDVRSELLM